MSKNNEDKPAQETEAVPMNNINNTGDDETLLKKNDENNENKANNTVEEKMNVDGTDVEAGEKSSGKRLSVEAIRSAAMTAAEEILESPRNRLILMITGALLLILFIVVCAILIFTCTDDSTYRFIRIVPKPKGPKNMITFVHGGDGSDGGSSRWMKKVQEIDDFLAPYRRPIGTTHCPNIAGGRKAANMSDDSVCKFDLNSVSKACLSGDYGYKTGTPCIFIVFNNIPDWSPYSGTSKSSNITAGDNLSDGFVKVECNPDHSFDLENSGPMDLTPFRGYSVMYFPYKGQDNYLSPFVVLKLAAPTHNVGISITCKLVSNNLYHESDARFRTEEPVPFIPFVVYIE